MATVRTILALCAAGVLIAGAAHAQGQPPQTPKSWNYTLDSQGRRVVKTNRVTNADGSWREELRQGNCVTVKERSATGEYKEARQCNPPSRG